MPPGGRVGSFPATGRGSNLYAGNGAAPATMTEQTWDAVMHGGRVDGADDADRSVPGAGESIPPPRARSKLNSNDYFVHLS